MDAKKHFVVPSNCLVPILSRACRVLCVLRLQDAFGNYIVQYVLDLKFADINEAITRHLKGQLLGTACPDSDAGGCPAAHCAFENHDPRYKHRLFTHHTRRVPGVLEYPDQPRGGLFLKKCDEARGRH